MTTKVVRRVELRIEESGTGSYAAQKWGGTTYERTQTVSGGGNPGKLFANTAEADLDLTALTKAREIIIRNLSTNATIYLGPKSGGVLIPFMELAPTESASITKDQTNAVTIRYKASANNTPFEINVVED